MKRIILFTALTVIFLSAFSQSYNDDFVGTWVYEKNDTVFKIKLQKGHTTYPGTGKSRETLVGGYSLSIKGIIQMIISDLFWICLPYNTPNYQIIISLFGVNIVIPKSPITLHLDFTT